MKHFHLLPILSLLFLVACENGSENITPGFYVFKGGLTLEADTNKATTERVITLTARYNPQLRGTGRLILHGSFTWGADTVIVLEPVADTLHRTGETDSSGESSLTVLPLDLIANETGVVEWKIRLVRFGDYAFDAGIFLDSVYIADSARMYALDSDEEYDVIEKYYPRGLEHVANAKRLYLSR